jgi:hypothetical protein
VPKADRVSVADQVSAADLPGSAGPEQKAGPVRDVDLSGDSNEEQAVPNAARVPRTMTMTTTKTKMRAPPTTMTSNGMSVKQGRSLVRS